MCLARRPPGWTTRVQRARGCVDVEVVVNPCVWEGRARHIVSTIRAPLYFKICQNIRAAQQPNRKWPQLHVYRPKHALRTFDSRIDRGDPGTEPPAHCHRDR